MNDNFTCPICGAVYSPIGYVDGEIFSCDYCSNKIQLIIKEDGFEVKLV